MTSQEMAQDLEIDRPSRASTAHKSYESFSRTDLPRDWDLPDDWAQTQQVHEKSYEYRQILQ